MTNDIHALAGAYALDALSETERAAFIRHLDGCETCALEVAELRETAARLADSTWSVPPPRLRENVLAQVRRTRQLRPPMTGRDLAGHRRWRRIAAGTVAAGVLALGAGASTYLVQEARLRDERSAAADVRAESAQIRAILAEPDAVLRTTTVDGGGRMTVVTSDRRDAGVVILDSLSVPGKDRAYQLWLLADGVPSSAGVLAAGGNGATTVIHRVRGAGLVAVTEEPAGGSVAPTTTPLASVPVR